MISYAIQESSDLELKRELIERKDFPQVRRGFDPKAVQDHLYEVAKAVAPGWQPEPLLSVPAQRS